MAKLKTIVFVAGVMLLILAAAVGYLSIKYLAAILPADSYEDKGVYTFSPYQVLPVQVQNTGASGRDRRMNPTKTAYMVYYRDTSGSGYQWSEQALTRELGQNVVDAGAAVERRVLTIPADRSYITVEPGQTAESYTAGLRQKYITALVLAGAYVILYGLAWCILIWMKKQREVRRYGETEKTITKRGRACPVTFAPARFAGMLWGQAAGGCVWSGRADKYIHAPGK